MSYLFDKRSKKKHLSKEAIRKIKYKQMMWKTYRHTGSEEDYSIYKEAFNQATAEIRNSKRSYKQKIAFNIKHDSKSFYAYLKSLIITDRRFRKLVAICALSTASQILFLAER